MKKTDCSNWAKARRQAGTTLILALVLLLLATLLGVFAMNVGIFAQRTSAADLRTRVMRETLEAALAQGVEYIKNNRKAVVANALGNPCTATDLTFPCGTVPQCATATSSADSSGSTSNGSTTCTGDLARRGKMFYYITPSGSVVDVNHNNATDDLDRRSLPLGSLQMATAGNGFTVNYGVGAVMCMVKKPAQPTDPTECTTDSNKAQGTYVFTLTAAGNISGESATSTDTSSNSTLSLTFGDSPSAPGVGKGATIIASGTADLNGNGTFVTNPNGAGNGLPLTVWTRECVNTGGAGTVNTCYMEDWMRTANGINGGSSYAFAKNSDGSDSTVVTCSGNGNKTCSCSNSLSAGSGNLVEGIDVLSNDAVGSCTGGNLPVYGTSACTGTNCKANDNIAETEFPCDLFQFIFNVQAWDDKEVQSPGTANTLCKEGNFSGGGDCFCAYHRPSTVTVADGSSQTMGVDEAWLYTNALYIYDTNNTRANWASAAKRATSCTDLATKGKLKGGIIWDRTGGCLSTSGLQFGYPDKPNLLVSDGTADLQGGTMFGMVFVRDTTAAGSTTTYGGAATFTSHSTGTIYGSVIVQGTAAKLNGSSSVVYSQIVMNNLLNLDSLYVASPVPGSWTDRYAY